MAISFQRTDDGWSWRLSEFLLSPSNEIGDTFAGIAGVLAFLWIIVTVWLQSQELADQREVLTEQRDEFAAQNLNMKEQLFENTFFQMLSTLGEIIEAIDLANANAATTTGRDCFKIYYGRLKKRSSKNAEGTFEERNDAFFEQYGHEFGHYFRFLYNFYRFIDENEHTKSHHLKVLRAFLSDYELLLLFYNCQTRDGKNFRKDIEKYEIFDNLPTARLISPDHLAKYHESAFGGSSGYKTWKVYVS